MSKVYTVHLMNPNRDGYTYCGRIHGPDGHGQSKGAGTVEALPPDDHIGPYERVCGACDIVAHPFGLGRHLGTRP